MEQPCPEGPLRRTRDHALPPFLQPGDVPVPGMRSQGNLREGWGQCGPQTDGAGRSRRPRLFRDHRNAHPGQKWRDFGRSGTGDPHHRKGACPGTEQAASRKAGAGQKMDAVATLAGGIAHKFNNLLTILLGHLELMGFRSPPDEMQAHSMDQMRDACLQMRDLTAQASRLCPRRQVSGGKTLSW